MAPGHGPDDRVRILGDLLVEREVTVDAHEHHGEVLLLLDRGEGVVHLAEELADAPRPARRIGLIPWPPGSRVAPPGPLWTIGKGLVVTSVKTVLVASKSRVGFSVSTSTR